MGGSKVDSVQTYALKFDCVFFRNGCVHFFHVERNSGEGVIECQFYWCIQGRFSLVGRHVGNHKIGLAIGYGKTDIREVLGCIVVCSGLSFLVKHRACRIRIVCPESYLFIGVVWPIFDGGVGV